jgi:bifunctional DNA-binding transcriptional regulator/antitoxin component of YhaV-PrlF toxin-antitoxin module
MKLVKFDKTNSATIRTKQAAVTVKADGQIVINNEAATKIGLKAGDTIAIFQDSETPTNWYLVKDKDGFKLRASGKTSPTLVTANPTVVKNLLASLKIESKDAVRFKMGTEAIKHEKLSLFAINTAEFRISERKTAKA